MTNGKNLHSEFGDTAMMTGLLQHCSNRSMTASRAPLRLPGAASSAPRELCLKLVGAHKSDSAVDGGIHTEENEEVQIFRTMGQN